MEIPLENDQKTRELICNFLADAYCHYYRNNPERFAYLELKPSKRQKDRIRYEKIKKHTHIFYRQIKTDSRQVEGCDTIGETWMAKFWYKKSIPSPRRNKLITLYDLIIMYSDYVWESEILEGSNLEHIKKKKRKSRFTNEEKKEIWKLLFGENVEVNNEAKHKEYYESKRREYYELIHDMPDIFEFYNRVERLKEEGDEVLDFTYNLISKIRHKRDVSALRNEENHEYIKKLFFEVVDANVIDNTNRALLDRLDNIFSDTKGNEDYKRYHRIIIIHALVISAIKNYCSKKIELLRRLSKDNDEKINQKAFIGLLLISVSIKNDKKREPFVKQTFPATGNKKYYKNLFDNFFHVLGCIRINKSVNADFSLLIPYSKSFDPIAQKIEQISKQLDISELLDLLDRAFWMTDSNKYKIITSLHSFFEIVDQKLINDLIIELDKGDRMSSNKQSKTCYDMYNFLANIFLLLPSQKHLDSTKLTEKDAIFYAKYQKKGSLADYYFHNLQYENVLPLYSKNKEYRIDYLINFASCAIIMGKNELSEHILNKINQKINKEWISLKPSRRWYWLANFCSLKGDYKNANSYYQLSLEIDPRNIELLRDSLWFYTSTVFDYEQANNVYQEIINMQFIRHNNVDLMGLRVYNLLFRNVHYNHLDSDINKLLEMENDNEYALLAGLIYFAKTRKYQKLDECWDIYTAKHSRWGNQFFPFLCFAGTVQMVVDYIKSHLKHCKRSAINRCIDFYLSQNRLADIDKIMLEYKSVKADSEFKYLKGVYNLKSKKYKAAIKIFKSLKERHDASENSQITFDLVAAYLCDNNMKRAKEIINEISTIDDELMIFTDILSALILAFEGANKSEVGFEEKLKKTFRKYLTKLFRTKWNTCDTDIMTKVFVRYNDYHIRELDWLQNLSNSPSLKMKLFETIENLWLIDKKKRDKN